MYLHHCPHKSLRDFPTDFSAVDRLLSCEVCHTLKIVNEDGQSVVVSIGETCPSCDVADIYLSLAAYNQIADVNVDGEKYPLLRNSKVDLVLRLIGSSFKVERCRFHNIGVQIVKYFCNDQSAGSVRLGKLK